MADPANNKGWRATLILIGAVTVARVLYIAFFCPYCLIEDETSYWDWSRHLEWSYYTKGPGIAWTIYAFTKVLGTSEFSVRLVAVIGSAIAAVCVAGLTGEITRGAPGGTARGGAGQWWRTAPFLGAAVFLLTPAFQMLGLISTIDGPYVACWGAAAWAGYLCFTRPTLGTWLALGAALGVGTLYKYTILLLIPALVVFAIMQSRARRRGATSPGALDSSHPPSGGSCPTPTQLEVSSLRFQIGPILGCLGLFAVICLPIVIWNQGHDWPTIRHLLGHLHVSGGDKTAEAPRYNPLWTLGYIGIQLGIAGPMLLLALAQAREAGAARRGNPRAWLGAAYLLLCAAPIYLFYLFVSFRVNPQGNWAVAYIVTLVPLAAWRAAENRGSRKTVHAWRATLIFGLLTGLGMLRVDLFSHVPKLGKLVPMSRIAGAELMGDDADRILALLREETGKDPFVMAQHYGRASQLAFYMKGRPTVYCTSSLMADGRLTPYDYWPETNLRNAPQLLGRPALMVGNLGEDWVPLFDKVEWLGALEGDGKRARPAFIGYNFKGFPKGGLRSPGAPELPEP